MALRFRRSLKIMPGVRVNFGKRGVSVSAGVRGATVTAGRRGVYGNIGLPGTGLSVRQRLDTPPSRKSGSSYSPAGSSPAATGFSCVLALSSSGTVEFRDSEGNALPPRLVKIVRAEKGADLERWLQQQCAHWNKGIDVLLRSHHDTPVPFHLPEYVAEPFAQPAPTRAPVLRPGFWHSAWCRIWRPARERVAVENKRRNAEYEEQSAAWLHAKEAHEVVAAESRRHYDAAMRGAAEAMQSYFEQRLQRVDFPWNSGVSFEIEYAALWIDLDLPEIEDLPTDVATVAARGLKINVKKRSDTQIRKEYMTLVHSLSFRVAGEAFAALPTIREVIVSSFSQRVDKATGHVTDDYLLSARIPRDQWETLNWSSIAAVDPVLTLERFDLVRKMTATGVFKPIVPHRPAAT